MHFPLGQAEGGWRREGKCRVRLEIGLGNLEILIQQFCGTRVNSCVECDLCPR